MRTISLVLTTCFLLLVQELFAQEEKADTYFEIENYRLALKYYNKALEKDSSNLYLNRQISKCYIKMNTDKSKALPFLEYILDVAPQKYVPQIYFDLGLVRFHSHEFIEAVRTFEYYKAFTDPQQHGLANEYIDYCFSADTVIQNKVKVRFENLGESINSNEDDYNPYVTADESRMLFSSKRDKRGSKIYMSKRQALNDNWEACTSAGSEINASNDQNICGLSPDGSTLFLYYNNYDAKNNNIVISDFDGKQFKGTTVMKGINSNAREEGACITLNKDTLFFASSRPGGFGGLDIYMSQRLPNDTWGHPVNLGPKINTPKDDNFPIISADGKKLFFSSKGHNSMGGYDIFSSNWNDIDNAWTQAKNIGYPINNTYDNLNISMMENERYAYVSAIRDDSYGELDIYKVIFVDKAPDYFVYSGLVTLENPLQNEAPIAIKSFEDAKFKVSVFDVERGDYYGVYACNPATGKYVLALPPGSYEIEVISPLEDYEDLIIPLKIREGTFHDQLTKNLVLKRRK